MTKYAWYVPLILITGCSPGNRPQELGETNRVLVDGNTPQELQARANGRVAVYDMTMKQALFTSPISAGQSLVIDPVTQQMTINGNPASTDKLPRGHELQIVFNRVN